MPPYQTSGGNTTTLNPVPATALWPGDQVYLFGTPTNPNAAPNDDTNISFEAVVLNERSIAVCLAPRPGGGAPPGVMVEVIASAAPGAAEIDVQDAALDADGAYLTPTSSAAYKITTFAAIGGGQSVGFTELQPEGGRFITLKVIANPNGVQFKAKLVYV